MNAIALLFSCLLITFAHNTFCVQTRELRASTHQQTSTSLAKSPKAKRVRFELNTEHKKMLALMIHCNRCDKSFEICCTCSRLFQMVDGETLIATHRHRFPRRAHSALPPAPICNGKKCPICDRQFEKMKELIAHVQGTNHNPPAHPIEFAVYKQELLNRHQKNCGAC